jgi:hypothetical protein
MPTGYTANVQEGKIKTLREYALCCARAFGALINMRDEPYDKPVPKILPMNMTYYDERIAARQKTFDEVTGLSISECTERARMEFGQLLKAHWERENTRATQQHRYEEMLTRVLNWKVPEELQGLKEFMTSQLQESIEHDCSYRSKAPVLLTGKNWRAKELANVVDDLAWYSKRRQEEIARVEDRNAWLKALWGSLESYV